MGTQLRGVCDAFEVTVDAPRRGDRQLQVEVVFTPGGPADRATIELRLYARRLGWLLRQSGTFDVEAAVPGTKAHLDRGATGRLRFTRPLPPFVTSYKGRTLELAAVLVTEGEDGSKLRLDVEAPPVAEDARLVVRGLPRSEAMRLNGIMGRLRRFRPAAQIEEVRPGTIAVTVEGGPVNTGGHVRIEALEYEWSGGSRYDAEPPIVTSAATFSRAPEGKLRAELALPQATAAPASIECSWGSDKQGVRWVARCELEDAGGKVTRGEVPLHVGVDRPQARPAR